MIMETERQLRERIEELEETIRQLLKKEGSRPDSDYCLALRITKRENEVLQVLLSNRTVTHDFLIESVFREEDEVQYERSTLNVFVYKLRKKLRPIGVEIKSIWGSGYYITQEDKQVLDSYVEQVMNGAQAALTSTSQVPLGLRPPNKTEA